MPRDSRGLTRERRDALIVAASGLVARIAVTLWAASRIPAAADGVYYDTVAMRIAHGDGYTWVWPDGAVTYAAHYPVGYPALLALGYVVFGAHPVVGMLVNSLLGAGAGVATWSLARRATSARLALAAGLAVALHPALVPYTPALMTEGPTAALLVIAGALAASRRVVATGLVVGVAVLVRPQSLLLAPILGALAGAMGAAPACPGPATTTPADGGRFAPAVAVAVARLHASRFGIAMGHAAIVTAVALMVCAPWTARNCARMEKCALVSLNGGWNLAIGTQTEDGAWREIVVPDECKEVFQEAAKDECFGRAARRTIAEKPGSWLARMPAKLHATFDYFGAAPWYLHSANSSAFSYDAKVVLATVETIASRALLIAALIALMRYAPIPRIPRRVVHVLVLVGVTSAITLHAWPGYVILGLLALAHWREQLLFPYSGAVLLGTAATHAVFFGAGRYGLVVVPFVTALAFVAPRAKEGVSEGLARRVGRPHAARVDAVQAIAGLTPKGGGREESPSSTERDAG